MILPISPKIFHQTVLHWYHQFGRKNLPWQINPTSYRVWVSEIMLQQTQVQTVIDYFNRFMILFPTVQALAKAQEDLVLQVWTGLGYYARARNLHKAAKIIVTEYHGNFPQTLETWMALPGIGQSTAGAIMSLALEKREAILDGNVKRLFARFHAVNEWTGDKQVEKTLWEWARHYLPKAQTREYNQALMDLGATLCTRGQPKCEHCPLQKLCVAYKNNLQAVLPVAKARAPIPTKHATLILLQNTRGEVLLEKRPSPGIWGGLWSFPQWVTSPSAQQLWCKKWRVTGQDIQQLPMIQHTFTHFHLHITPILVCLPDQVNYKALAQSLSEQPTCWYDPRALADRGFPAPIKRLLQQLEVSHA